MKNQGRYRHLRVDWVGECAGDCAAGIELGAGGGGCAALRGAPCIKFYALAASYWEHAVCEPAFARPELGGGSN